MENFNLLRLALIITVIIYFIFEHFDEKQLKDEREELIRLKTFELVHKVTTTALCLLAVLYVFFPWMPALYPMLVVVFFFSVHRDYRKVLF